MYFSGRIRKQVSEVVLGWLMKVGGENLRWFCSADLGAYQLQDSLHVQKPVQV